MQETVLVNPRNLALHNSVAWPLMQVFLVTFEEVAINPTSVNPLSQWSLAAAVRARQVTAKVLQIHRPAPRTPGDQVLPFGSLLRLNGADGKQGTHVGLHPVSGAGKRSYGMIGTFLTTWTPYD